MVRAAEERWLENRNQESLKVFSDFGEQTR
jgi:hypothetical protein